MKSFKKYLEIVQEDYEIIDESSKIMGFLTGVLMMFPVFNSLSKDLKTSVIEEIKKDSKLIKEIKKDSELGINLKEQENYNRLQQRILEVISKVNKEKKDLVVEIKKKLNQIDPKDYAGNDKEFNDLIKEFENKFMTQYEFAGRHVFTLENKQKFINFMDSKISDL
jgi:hypothetical protein